MLLWCSSCTWRKGRVGNALDRGHVVVVDDDKGLLPVPVQDCCTIVCVSRLPLPSPLSDRVPVAAAVVFQLHLEGGRHRNKDADRRLPRELSRT